MRTLRYVLGALIGILIAFGILVPAASMVAPAFGREIFAIRGHSMSPTIPMGAAILVTHRDVADVNPGDIVTWQSPNGAYVTHRVLQVVEENGQLLVQTKGDANDSPDPSAVPASAFIGVVEGWVPAAGYGMILMSTLAGLISWLSFGLALVAADAYIATMIKERERGGPAADAGDTRRRTRRTAARGGGLAKVSSGPERTRAEVE
jgi:signal peptidase I